MFLKQQVSNFMKGIKAMNIQKLLLVTVCFFMKENPVYASKIPADVAKEEALTGFSRSSVLQHEAPASFADIRIKRVPESLVIQVSNGQFTEEQAIHALVPLWTETTAPVRMVLHIQNATVEPPHLLDSFVLAIAKKAHLMEIKLVNSDVTDLTVRTIYSALHQDAEGYPLVSLDLSGNPLTSESLPSLRALRGVYPDLRVKLEGTGITVDMLDELGEESVGPQADQQSHESIPALGDEAAGGDATTRASLLPETDRLVDELIEKATAAAKALARKAVEEAAAALEVAKGEATAATKKAEQAASKAAAAIERAEKEAAAALKKAEEEAKKAAQQAVSVVHTTVEKARKWLGKKKK